MNGCYQECECEHPLIRCDDKGCNCTRCGRPEKVELGGTSVKRSANEVQIGGDHYKSEYEHWDFVENNGLGYLEAAATKYAVRWRKKNGRQDLEKAMHYIDKLAELHESRHRLPRGVAPLDDIVEFCSTNKVPATECAVVRALSRWSSLKDLNAARAAVQLLIEQCDNEAGRPDQTGQEHPFGYDPDEELTGASLQEALKSGY